MGPAYRVVHVIRVHSPNKLLRHLVPPDEFLDADDVQDNVDVGAIGVAVVVAAAAGRRMLAGAAHVATFYHVAEALEGAVVLAPPVLDLGVAEAHIVEELLLELLHPEDVAGLLDEVHDLAMFGAEPPLERQKSVAQKWLLFQLLYTTVFRVQSSCAKLKHINL